MNVVFMFPGQSSRYPGMLSELAALDERNRLLIETASDLLDRDLAAHYSADNPDAYACNQDVQIGVFLANHLFLQLVQAAGVRADASLGLSLGEWNHLVHVGALSFPQALEAVEARGAAYDAGPRGAMASVFPIGFDELQESVDGITDAGVLEITNLNSPRQQVLSGETKAIERAVQVLEDEHYLQAVIIERQVPMHCSTFQPVGVEFRKVLETLDFAKPRLPYLPNRLAELLPEPSKSDFVDLLSTHVHEPVLWKKSIDLVVETFPDPVLVEVGPKRVLFNLLDRKWHRGVAKLHTDTNEDKAAHLEQVLAELGAGGAKG
ncbi:MAG: ACP S-malonyltransferase [Deltaproteobacteria bacterium]|jgi:[acyl-carrier-protein] S-malonyltransferase|nr:ACP S-malonyltransferase [Deltaproteobacteria bacterium]MBW2536581.1 ACP S-malonyltransferase [Deltaproteobacteria bacterium]